MGLELAGAISGMGQGLERGLLQLQGGLIQHGLQESDRKFQTEKLQLQMAHAEKLATARQEFDLKENAATRTSNEGIAAKKLEADREEAGWRSMAEEGKRIDTEAYRKSELALAKDKLDVERRAEIDKGIYYKAYAGYLDRRNPEQISEKDKGKIQFLNNRLKALEDERKALELKQIEPNKNPMADPKEESARQAKIKNRIAEIDKKTSELSRQGLNFFGVSPDDEPQSSEPEFKVPTFKSSPTAPQGGPTSTPGPQSSVAPSVYPNQKQPHGPQGLVNRLWDAIAE